MSRRRVKLGGEVVLINAHPLPGEIDAWQRFIASDTIFGLDVETTAIEDSGGAPMFDPNARMRLIQFGSKTEAWVFDPHNPFWRPHIEALLSRSDRRFVTHTNYDPLWCRTEFDIDLAERAIDTRVISRLNRPSDYNARGQRNSHTLKDLSTEFIDSTLVDAEAAMLARFKELAPPGFRVGKKCKAWGFTNIDVTDELFTLYGGLDAICVRILLDLLANRMPKVMRPLGRKEQRIAQLATDMQWRGHRLDLDYTHDLLDNLTTEYNEANDELTELFGFKPLSYAKRGQWFLDRGAEFDKLTDGSAPAINADTIEGLMRAYPDGEVGRAFYLVNELSTRENVKRNVTICLDSADQHGFTHSAINTCTAVTGRMGVREPAMQTFKKNDPRLRGCYITRDDGWLFVGADYDSQELRLALAFSGDPLLRKIIYGGLKQHAETARSVFPNFVSKEETPDLYDAAKILNFSQQYGSGPYNIGEQLGLKPNTRERPNRRAFEMWLKWRESYAGLVEWTQAMSERPYIVNPWGRVIPADRWRKYANGNYMIQSSGRDVLGDALVKLDEYGWSPYLWLPIHDEIVLEVPEEWAEDAAEALVNAMFTKVRGIPLTATPKILGRRWNGQDEMAT